LNSIEIEILISFHVFDFFLNFNQCTWNKFKVLDSIQFKLHTMPFNNNVTCVVDPSMNTLPNTLTHEGLSSGTKNVGRIMFVGVIMVWLCHWLKCE
jgi:hypothetical protein